MTGRDLLGYLRIHARTQRALVHRDHLCELHHMAGAPCPLATRREKFLSIADGQAYWLLDAAEYAEPLPRWMMVSKG